MEGILWKWTNYWSGWQTRWFILDNGVLAYYKSQEDVSQGCKGSMKVAACQINVNALDPTRLDLVIPGEQQIFLRASSTQERQLWLVALGSTKACVQSRGRGDTGESKPDALKSKRSELRLYCDLLMQQVHSLKTAALSETGPDMKQMDEATNLLGATCDTFITTLEECMKLSNAQTGSSLYDPQGLASTPVLPPTPTILNGRKDRATKFVNRSCSEDSSK